MAIVTGASQGIGRAAALEPVAEAVRAKGRRALAVACDVGDARQVDAAVARALDEFGRVDLSSSSSRRPWAV